MNGNLISDATRSVVIGECLCPGTPHAEDAAEVAEELSWDVLAEVGTLTGVAAYRRLVLGALVGWNLCDEDGEPIPITSDTVGRLRHDRMEPIAAAINDAYARAQDPLPNSSGAPSRRSRRESATSPNPTIRPRAGRGR